MWQHGIVIDIVKRVTSRYNGHAAIIKMDNGLYRAIDNSHWYRDGTHVVIGSDAWIDGRNGLTTCKRTVEV